MLTSNPKLTPREIQVIKLLLKEYSTKDIARQLNIGIRTVDTYRKNISAKTDTHSLIGLTKYAIRRGWIQDYYHINSF